MGDDNSGHLCLLPPFILFYSPFLSTLPSACSGFLLPLYGIPSEWGPIMETSMSVEKILWCMHLCNFVKRSNFLKRSQMEFPQNVVMGIDRTEAWKKRSARNTNHNLLKVASQYMFAEWTGSESKKRFMSQNTQPGTLPPFFLFWTKNLAFSLSHLWKEASLFIGNLETHTL